MTIPLKITNLKKTYAGGITGKGIEALKGVSLEVHSGEIFGLLGPNGAGKTTLVKSILGILKPTSGSCELFGRQLSDPTARAKVGYLQENHRFPRNMTGRELITLAGRLTGMPDSAIRQRADLLLNRVGMLEWADTKFAKYSKGMAQRVGIAQALIHDPDLLILDEPTDGVDPVGRAEIGKLIRDLKAEGKTTLINSHALAEVENICDRVAILNQGRALTIGSVAELTAIGLEYVIQGAFNDDCIHPPEEIASIISFSNNELIAHVVTDSDIDRLSDWLRGHGASIRSLSQRRRSLETVFLELVEEARAEVNGVTREAPAPLTSAAQDSPTEKTTEKG